MGEFFDWIVDFFLVGLWENLQDLILWGFERFQIFILYVGEASIVRITTYISELVGNADLTGTVQGLYDVLPDDIQALLTLLQFGPSLTVILGAYVTAGTLSVLQKIF